MPDLHTTMNARALIAPLAMTVASLYAPAAADARQWAPTRAQATVARVVAAADVRAEPGAGKVLTRVGTQAPWTGGPVRLLVLAGRLRRHRNAVAEGAPAGPPQPCGRVD